MYKNDVSLALWNVLDTLVRLKIDKKLIRFFRIYGLLGEYPLISRQIFLCDDYHFHVDHYSDPIAYMLMDMLASFH